METVKLLLSYGADSHNRNLALAEVFERTSGSAKGLEIALALLEAGANPSVKDFRGDPLLYNIVDDVQPSPPSVKELPGYAKASAK